VFVDQVVRQQPVHECTAAVDEEVLAGLLFQVGDCVGDVALEQRAVPLEWFSQRGRGDELGQAVHPVGERVARPPRPGRGELLVGDPAEQKRAAREQLLGLPPRDLVVPVRNRPAAMLVLAGIAGILRDAVQGQVLGCDDSSHLTLLRWWSSARWLWW